MDDKKKVTKKKEKAPISLAQKINEKLQKDVKKKKEMIEN